MRALLKVLKSIDSAIAAVELTVAIAALAVILALESTKIALRATGGDAAAFWWASPLALYLLLTSVFLGASLALRSRRHIQIDIVTRAMPRRMKAGMGTLGWLVAAAILGLLTRSAVYYIASNWAQPSKLRGVEAFGWHVPDLTLGYLQIVMPIALSVMTLRCLLACLEDLRGVVTGDTAYMAQYEHVEGAELAPPLSGEEIIAAAHGSESEGAS